MEENKDNSQIVLTEEERINLLMHMKMCDAILKGVIMGGTSPIQPKVKPPKKSGGSRAPKLTDEEKAAKKERKKEYQRQYYQTVVKPKQQARSPQRQTAEAH